MLSSIQICICSIYPRRLSEQIGVNDEKHQHRHHKMNKYSDKKNQFMNNYFWECSHLFGNVPIYSIFTFY